MEPFSTAHSMISLIGQKCELNHGDNKERKAVDFLCQKLKNDSTGDETIIQIPVCEECAVALHSEKYVLLFCMNCLNSQWIHKPSSKKPYLYTNGEHIKWLDKCPKCSN